MSKDISRHLHHLKLLRSKASMLSVKISPLGTQLCYIVTILLSSLVLVGVLQTSYRNVTLYYNWYSSYLIMPN